MRADARPQPDAACPQSDAARPRPDAARLERLRSALARASIDALVCRLPENVLLLTSYWPMCGWVYAVLPAEGPVICILPDTEEEEAHAEAGEASLRTYPFGTKEKTDQAARVRDALEAARGGRKWRHVGFEAGFETTAPAWNAGEPLVPAAQSRRLLEEVFGASALVDATELLEAERAVKTDSEVEKVARAARISCLGLEEFFNRVDAGVSGVELAAAVESAIMSRGTGFEGARRVRAFAQVATGSRETFRAWRPMEISTTRKLERGDVALLELGVVADGFWCDRTRARSAGAATARQKELNEIVRRAQAAAISAVRPGASGVEVDEAARKVIRDSGFGDAFIHVTGHGLGFRYHESLPNLAPWSADVLQEGMIHSVEPGIYLHNEGGIRIEDDVLVTSAGAEVLGPFSVEIG